MDVVISRGLRDLEEQKKKKKKHRKRNRDHHASSEDMFAMPDSLMLPPSRSQIVNSASGMSSLEALKAVTGAGLPQSVPASPLLPSAGSAVATLPEESRSALPLEEGSAGRYSFGQNLKPTGSSNFIRQLIAKTSSKRYTSGSEKPDDHTKLPVSKRKRRHRNKHSSVDEQGTFGTSNSHSGSTAGNQEDLSLNLLLPSSHHTSEQNLISPEMSSRPILRQPDHTLVFDEDIEPNCSLGLTRAEEELINQSIKGVDEDGLMDTDKMVVDEVLTEDITKDDLSSMEVLTSDVLSTTIISSPTAVEIVSDTVLKSSDTSPKSVDFVAPNGVVPESDIVKRDVYVEKNLLLNGNKNEEFCTNQSVLSKPSVLQQNCSDNLQNYGFNNVQQLQNRKGSSKEIDYISTNILEKHVVCEQKADGFSFETADVECDQTQIEDENCNMEHETLNDDIHFDSVETTECMDTNMEINIVENLDVSAEEVNSDVIYDVLDTCATFEVGEKEIVEEDHTDTTEEKELELIQAKISQDLASGLTIDKTKSTGQNQVDTDNADTDEFSIMASVCDALLHMSDATNFTASPKDQSVLQIETKPVEDKAPVTVPEPVVEDAIQVQEAVEVGLVTEVAVPTIVDKPPVTIEDKAPLTIEDKPLVNDAVKPSNEAASETAESELCLPSDFIIDEELLSESVAKPHSTEKNVEKLSVQPKLVADQDIVTILNSIMSNRAFLDDPVVRAQRNKEDSYFKKLHGLKRDIRIRIKAIAELVVQRAVLGPVPVRTIRNIYRRAYYVGNVKIDEFQTQELLPPSAGGAAKAPGAGGVKKARVLLPKVWPSQVFRNVQIIRPPPPSPQVGVNKPASGDNASPLTSIIKKGKKGLGCPICPRTYLISQKMLDLHLQFHIDNARNLHCPVCGKAGTIWTNILKHYMSHPEIKNNASLYEMILATCDKDRTQCGQCNTLFAMRNALIHHLASSHVGEKVNGSTQIHLVEEIPIKQATSDPTQLPKGEADTKDLNYLCPNCPYSTKTHYNLVLHNHECQGNVQKFGDSFAKVLDDLTPQFKCSLCGYCGVSSKQLEQHVHLHHDGSNTTHNRTPLAKPQELKYKCELCPSKFRTKDQYRAHLNQHKEDQMFMCKACSYKCRYKKNMHKHAKKMHPDLSLKGLIQAPRKGKMVYAKQQKSLIAGDNEDAKDVEQEEDEDEGIPTATVVVHTDENGELTVCDENDVPSIPLQQEQTTFLLDSSVLGGSAVTLGGSAVTLDGSAVTLDGSAVTLDGSALTLDGNVLQILQNDGTSGNGQPKVLLLSVGPSELGSFTIAGQNDIS